MHEAVKEVDADAFGDKDARGEARKLLGSVAVIVADHDAAAARILLGDQEMLAKALRRLDDDEVVHARKARGDGRAKAGSAKGDALAEALLEHGPIALVAKRCDLIARAGALNRR